MIIRPISVKEAMRVCAAVHRRHPSMRGALWALAAVDDDLGIVGIATVGRPPRMLQRGCERLVVTRVAVQELPRIGEHANSACSMLYGRCARVAREMGATDMWTYLHEDEPGVSLKAAGWVCDGHVTDDESHDRPSRRRPNAASAKSGRKTRWWAPWSAMLPALLARRAA